MPLSAGKMVGRDRVASTVGTSAAGGVSDGWRGSCAATPPPGAAVDSCMTNWPEGLGPSLDSSEGLDRTPARGPSPEVASGGFLVVSGSDPVGGTMQLF
ncbi:unnamed protein product [Lampetra fluviatilis]